MPITRIPPGRKEGKDYHAKMGRLLREMLYCRTPNCTFSLFLNSTIAYKSYFPVQCTMQKSYVQYQRVSKKLTSTLALQVVHCGQETMICMYWFSTCHPVYLRIAGSQRNRDRWPRNCLRRSRQAWRWSTQGLISMDSSFFEGPGFIYAAFN